MARDDDAIPVAQRAANLHAIPAHAEDLDRQALHMTRLQPEHDGLGPGRIHDRSERNEEPVVVECAQHDPRGHARKQPFDGGQRHEHGKQVSLTRSGRGDRAHACVDGGKRCQRELDVRRGVAADPMHDRARYPDLDLERAVAREAQDHDARSRVLPLANADFAHGSRKGGA